MSFSTVSEYDVERGEYDDHIDILLYKVAKRKKTFHGHSPQTKTLASKIEYKNVGREYKHQFLSWYNLFFCSKCYDPITDNAYMETAVQRGMKTAATVLHLSTTTRKGHRFKRHLPEFIADWPTLDPMFTVAGRSMTGRDDEGNLVITFMSEDTVDLYDKWYSLIFETEGVYAAPEPTDGTIGSFVEGHILIIYGIVQNAFDMANMEDGYGIIPYPKWDENQDRYYTMPSDSATLLYVLKTADLSDNRIGDVVEALNYFSQRDVFPAYYDILLKGWYSLDENTTAIIDMVVPNARYEFAVQFSEFAARPSTGYPASCGTCCKNRSQISLLHTKRW